MNINTNKHEYIEQNGCHNCKRVFIFEEYDSLLEYYCNMDNDRPKCGSCLMEEMFNFERKDIDEWDIWQEWSNKNTVAPWGTCKKWEED